jgi:ribosomal protein L40E
MKRGISMLTTTFVTCKQCGGESPHDAQYCIECGDALGAAIGVTTKLVTPTCQGCGAENLPDARFCAMCGREVAASATIGQPWANTVSAAKPRRIPVAKMAARPMPPLQPAPHSAMPAPVAAAPTPHRRRYRHRHGPPPAFIVGAAGLIGLLILKMATWPFLLLLLGLVFIVHQADRGRAAEALRTVAIMGAGFLVLTNPRYWPLMLILFGVLKFWR